MSQFLHNKVSWMQIAIRAYSLALKVECHDEKSDYLRDHPEAHEYNVGGTYNCEVCELAVKLLWVIQMLDVGETPKEQLENGIEAIEALITRIPEPSPFAFEGVDEDLGGLVWRFQTMMKNAIASAEKEDAEAKVEAKTRG
ncbi:hypothetical protein HK104_004676 [Borealophlyctis nickersoniae]|nr:hypothetical protein HK104_004676 [Borealophlyctis nickersoniae]